MLQLPLTTRGDNGSKILQGYSDYSHLAFFPPISYKTVISGPFKDFTAVIGPNGAGKSNLMDAISFVLGVRSGQLRSTQLRDLIYKAGEREEQSRPANKASVTAVYIDHKTGERHRFSRAITVSSEKSGSSVYSINEKVVRWEEYQSALEGFDILVKAKNFLVFQGDVEAVASQNPAALSRLIDQISGSLELAGEYEKKKTAHAEASKHSNDQVIKRRVINGEIKDFKQQKAEMEGFNRLCTERDREEVHMLLWKLYHIGVKLTDHSESIKSKNERLTNVRSENLQLERAVVQARKDLTQATKNVLQAERRLAEKEKKKEDDYLPGLMESEERIKHVEKRMAKEQNSKATISKDHAAKTVELEKLGRDLVVITEAQTQLLAQKQALAPVMTLSEEDLKEYHVIKAQCLTKCSQERETVKNLIRELRNQENKLSQREDRLEQCQNRRQKLDSEYEDSVNKKTTLENKIDTQKRELLKAKKHLHELQAERTRHAQTETELKEKLQDCLKQLFEVGAVKQETDTEARNRAMGDTLRRIFPGVKGRLHELCSPLARKHEIAVKVVLGRNLEAVVVDNEKTAIDCVEYLKNQRLGRATFIPLDTIVAHPVNERFRNLAKGARLAIDLIKYESVYERAMQYACGSTIICDSLQIARHVIYDKNNQVKAVTLEGTVIHKGGNITGGISGVDNSRKFDERAVQALKRAQEDILAQIKENSKNLPRNTDEVLIADIARLENEIELLRDDLRAIDDRLRAVMDELTSLAENQGLLQAAVEKDQHEVEQSRVQLKKTEATIDAVEDKIFVSFCRKIGVKNIREYEGHHLEVHQKASEEQVRLESTLARVKLQISFETSQLQGLVERLSTLEASAERNRRSLEELMTTKHEIGNDIQSIDDEIMETKLQLAQLSNAQEQMSKAVADAKKKLLKSTRELDQILKDIATDNDEIDRLGADRLSIYRRCKLESIDLPLLQGDLARVPIDEAMRPVADMNIDGPEETQEALVLEDFGIVVDYGELGEDEKEDEGREVERQLEEKVERLKSKLEAMAPKGRSVEKLEEVEARLREHEKEFEVARKLAKQTKDDFTRLKDQRVELFTKAFTHISQKIDLVYKELTKGRANPMGGVAYLTLEDPEEPYLHGIKYYAMPPMKRFRDMDQLSGGEKTMAALALLFAVHSYQPSPFFVLDEVDAALDNTNVGRIADYVRNKANEAFQFVVISLKGTFYEKANGLVGIFRDNEWGGTKSLTLNLDQYGE